MSHSARLRLTDFRNVVQLVGECRDLGDDGPSWHRHLAVGLSRLAGGGLALVGELGGASGQELYSLGVVNWGWENGFAPAVWAQMLQEFELNPLYSPPMNAYLPRTIDQPGACLARTDLIADSDWFGTWYYENLHRGIGAENIVYCVRTLPGSADKHSGFILARTPGEPDFTGRQKAVVREVNAQVAPLLGGALARLTEPSPSKLPARSRAVLRCLLEGDSDKQIAKRLKLSAFTVNGHVKVIYRHFGVESRPELLARWIRRGWGAGAAWLE